MIGIIETHTTFHSSLLKTYMRWTTHAGRKRKHPVVRDQVWLSPRMMPTFRRSRHLDFKHTCLSMLGRIMNMNNYNVELLNTIWNNHVCHQLLLHSYTPPIIDQSSTEQYFKLVEWEEKYTGHIIIDCRWNVKKLDYHSEWIGYIQICMSRQWGEHFKTEHGLVENFKQEHTELAWQWSYRVRYWRVTGFGCSWVVSCILKLLNCLLISSHLMLSWYKCCL